MSILWPQMLPERSDRHVLTGHFDFNAALQRGLSRVGAQISEAAGICPRSSDLVRGNAAPENPPN